MGQGELVMKRIDNTNTREVSFCRRKNGLFKKAHELSVLCDAELAVIIFSSRGKLFEFGNVGVRETLNRYQLSNSQETLSCCHELTKLKAQYEGLQRNQRILLGEDLGPLNVKELEKLEIQLEEALARTRERKTQLMLEQIEELRKRGRFLGDINKQLKLKLEAGQLEIKLEAEEQSYKALQGFWNSYPMGSTSIQPILHMGHHDYIQQGEGSSIQKNMGDSETHLTRGWLV